MGRYHFESAGGQATSAIEQFLRQQQELERQAQIDAFRQKATEEEQRQRSEQLGLTRRAQDLSERQHADALAETTRQHDAQRAGNIAETMLPGIVDPGTADLLNQYGYGGLAQHVDVPGTPGVMDSAGGFRYQQARAQEQARAEQAQAAQQAAAERAAADRQSREQIASEGNATRQTIAAAAAGGRNANADLQRQILQDKVDAAAQKRDEAATATQNSANGQHELGQGILAELDRLQTADKKGGYGLSSGAQSITGPARVPGIVAGLGLPFMGDASNATASLKGLIAKLDINKLRELKAQSKTGATGFGALSARELSVIENAAAMLDTAQTEDVFNERLNEIRSAAQKLMGAGGTTMNAPGGGRVTIKSITQLP